MIKYQRLKKKVLGPNSHDLFLWKRIGNWSAVIFRPNGWMGKKTGKFMHEERSGVDWTSFIIPSLTPLSCGIVLNTITIYNEEGKRWNEGNVRPNRWLENCMRLYWMPSLRRFGTYTYVNYLLLYVEYADPNAANTVHQSNSMTPHKWLPVFWSQQVSISFSSFCTPVMNWAAPTVDNVFTMNHSRL